MEDNDVVMSQAVVVRERSSVLLMPVMDVNTAMVRLREFQDFCAKYLTESKDGGSDGGDYGVIPGTKKSTLLKSGADKLCEVYGLYDEYVTMSTVEDWEKGLFDYTLQCVLKSRRDDSVVGTGVGSCSTFESKYRWRDSQRICPTCGSTAIIKGKTEFGGGWLCWGKKGGCGGKFKDGDKSIEGQVIGRVENPDIVDTKNTALKMAKKRAKIDAVIGVTRSAGIFTQDLDDLPPIITAPVKPVEVTTEDIVIGGPGKPVGGAVEPLVKGEAAPQATEDAIYIDQGQAANLHRTFRDSLKPANRKQAEALLHDWLKMQKIVNEQGEGSASFIRRHSFYDVREEAVTHAKSL